MKRTRLRIYTINQEEHFDYSKQQEKNKMSKNKKEIQVLMPTGYGGEQEPSDDDKKKLRDEWEKSGMLMNTAVLANITSRKDRQQDADGDPGVLLPAGFGSDNQ